MKINTLEKRRSRIITELHKLDIKYRNSFNKSVISRLHNLRAIEDYRQNIVDQSAMLNHDLDNLDIEQDKLFRIQNFLIDVFYLLFK